MGAEAQEVRERSVAPSMVPEPISQKKGTYKKRRNERKGSGGEAVAQGGSAERKRQVPEEIDVDSLSLKKLKWARDLSIKEDLSRVGEGDLDLLHEKAGLQEQFRPAK